VNCYTKSLVTKKKIDISIITNEKKRVIAREKVLNWIDPDPRGLAAIGGLELLKVWLEDRRGDFSAEARNFGIVAPKGALIVGLPGTGKSFTAKCIATAWEMPLLRLDMGALKSKYVGESEGNIRKALQTAEAVAPCVLWLDEIEKALAGASGTQGDGGVSTDALGAILTWMQEKVGSVFVIATANDVQALPPEFTRKGRFDEVFWIDLPNVRERVEILAVSLRRLAHGGSVQHTEMVQIAEENMKDFTGAEIASVVESALRIAYRDGARDISVDDLRKASSTVVPVAKSAAEKLGKLRAWGRTNARPACSEESLVSTKMSEPQHEAEGRRVDLGSDDEDENMPEDDE
jgi:SpoVK/Ycf46/Vps4 family AAA+-type ATPase